MLVEEAAWLYVFAYLGAIGLILLGLYGLVMSRHLIRMILGLSLLEAGVNLFLIAAGYRPGGVAPILTEATRGLLMVDPIPQALVLTAIVIGVGVQALALALVIKVYQAYGTLDMDALTAHIAAVPVARSAPTSVSAEEASP